MSTDALIFELTATWSTNDLINLEWRLFKLGFYAAAYRNVDYFLAYCPPVRLPLEIEYCFHLARASAINIHNTYAHFRALNSNALVFDDLLTR